MQKSDRGCRSFHQALVQFLKLAMPKPRDPTNSCSYHPNKILFLFCISSTHTPTSAQKFKKFATFTPTMKYWGRSREEEETRASSRVSFKLYDTKEGLWRRSRRQLLGGHRQTSIPKLRQEAWMRGKVDKQKKNIVERTAIKWWLITSGEWGWNERTKRKEGLENKT